ncbi:MAG: hypothetical protein ACI9GM_000469 [Salibacteraceae bacterium]|jgi:hypothetical protein
MFLSVSSFAQEKKNSWKTFPTKDTNSVSGKEGVLSDQWSDSLLNTPTAVSKKGMKTTLISDAIMAENQKYINQSKAHPQIKGYTILLYSGSGANSRMKAREVLIKFQGRYTNGVTHLAWKSPNYEVRLGDYRTKTEAQRDLVLIKAEFPTAFIKTDMIELPALEKTVLEAI